MGESIVRVMIDLSKYEIQMLINSIESALDTQHMQEENVGRVKEIRDEFSKYL